MPHFKHTNHDQIKMTPVDFKSQLSPGTFEHTLDYIIKEKLDLSPFHPIFQNDKNCRSAYDPVILLKIILFANSKGIISRREIQ